MPKTTRAEPVSRVRVNRLPPPPDLPTRRAYERIGPHAGDPGWLPKGEWPEADELRVEHHRHLRQVNAAARALADLDAEHREADAEHAEKLKQAHRDGDDAPADDRLSPVDRAAMREPLVENTYAAALALAEFIGHVINVIRANEDPWMGSLRARVAGVEEKHREAQRLVAEARADAWVLDRMGRWLTRAADDDHRGQEPAPSKQQLEGGAPTASWQANPRSLERHWSEKRPWNDRSPEEDRKLREWNGTRAEPAEPAGPDEGLILPLSDRSAA